MKNLRNSKGNLGGLRFNLEPEEAYNLMETELNFPKSKKYFPTIGLEVKLDQGDYYVNFGWQDNLVKFSKDLDNIYGFDPSKRPINNENEQYGGGVTRLYTFTDNDESSTDLSPVKNTSPNNYFIWTNVCKKDQNEIVNKYLMAHEEAHALHKLNKRDELVSKITKKFPLWGLTYKECINGLLSYDEIYKGVTDSLNEEELSSLAGFLPFNSDLEIDTLMNIFDNYDITNKKEIFDMYNLLERNKKLKSAHIREPQGVKGVK